MNWKTALAGLVMFAMAGCASQVEVDYVECATFKAYALDANSSPHTALGGTGLFVMYKIKEIRNNSGEPVHITADNFLTVTPNKTSNIAGGDPALLPGHFWAEEFLNASKSPVHPAQACFIKVAEADNINNLMAKQIPLIGQAVGDVKVVMKNVAPNAPVAQIIPVALPSTAINACENH